MLLYTIEDIDRQHKMTSGSRLTQPEINAVLRSLRNLDRKTNTNVEIIATTGRFFSRTRSTNSKETRPPTTRG